MLKRFNKGIVKARRAFSMISPNPLFLLKSPLVAPAIITTHVVAGLIKRKPIADLIGETIGGSIMNVAGRRFLSDQLKRQTHIAFYSTAKPWNKVNGLGGRSEMIMRPEIDADADGRIIKRMVIVYHHANKAGKHIDVHIGRRSLVYRVSGKPVEKLIKFNSNGMLTEASKKALLDHLRKEIGNNSRVAQNLDHSITNARMTWPFTPELEKAEGYGAGPTRQIIAEEDVEFYHPQVHSSLHLYSGILSPNQGLYLYQLYPGNEKKAPIVIFGKLNPLPKKFEDRLHLTLIQPEEFEEKFVGRIDKLTTTRKYDGASTYFYSDGTERGMGFKFFSPRISKETGKQIEYTYKLPELADKGSDHKPVGMGETLFWRHTPIGEILNLFGIRGPEGLAWNYLPASAIGGILNSNSIRPRDVHPELRVYRMDRWDGKNVHNLSFFENRALQLALCNELGGPWKVVALSRPVRNRTTLGWEGFVGVPPGESVNNGLKVKWWGDANDWEVIRNELSISKKGNIQGVIWFKSLESGKEFKLGPGQIGSFDDCMALIDAGDSIIGMVAKVHGRQGHEGRAAKIVEWHMDKGKVPNWFKG